MKKRLLAILLLTALLCTLLPLPASAATSGTCGDDLLWSFDVQTGRLTVAGSGEMYDYQNGTFAPWHSFCDDILSVSLPGGLTGIGSLAFAECGSLNSITVPEGVSDIGHSAFYYCTGLQKVTLPSSIKTIGAYSFANCWKLADCSLPKGLEHISAYAFQSCAITQAILPDTVKVIDEGAFSSCEKLKTVSVPEGVTELPDEAFSYCKALTDVTLPDSMTTIGDSAFSFCRTLTKLTLPAKLTGLGTAAFAECNKLQSVSIPQGVTRLSPALFEYCYDLQSVTLPSGVAVIDKDAFFCSGIGSVTLPANVAEIGDYAFCGCENLLHVHCLGDLPKLGEGVLKYCTEDTAFCYLPGAEGWNNCTYHTEPFAVVETAAATCTENGAAEYRCSCGEAYLAGETAALGHDYAEGFCTRCGAKDPNYTPPTPKDPCEGYTDINRNGWYHDAADFVISRGLMGSTKTDALTFEPMTKVSRAMVASILYRMADSPAVEYKATFTDVPADKWFTSAIEWCAQNGLASGKGNGKFDPNGNVTRQELAVFMMKMAEYFGEDTSGRADLGTFADVAKVSAWAKTYLEWAVNAGIISGQAEGGKTYLNPTAGAMRCELASILMRFFAR